MPYAVCSKNVKMSARRHLELSGLGRYHAVPYPYRYFANLETYAPVPAESLKPPPPPLLRNPLSRQ